MNETFFSHKTFYRFFYPAVFSSLSLAVANLADALCVGFRMGESALAAISLVTPIWMIFNVLDVGFAVGGAVTFAQLLGAGRARRAVDVFGQLLSCVLVISVTIAVLGTIFLEPVLAVLGVNAGMGVVYEMTREYARWLLLSAPLYFLNFLFYHFIRCDDGERRAGVGLTVSNLLDVGLSFVLVLGLDLGVKGAIWSTILGTAAGLLIYLPHFLIKSNILSLRLHKPVAATVVSCFKTGFSSSSQYLWQFFLFLVLNNLLIRRHGDGALAIFNVVLNVSYVVMGLFDGVGATIQPLSATFHAERNRSAERQTLKLAFAWGIGLGAVLLAAVALFAPGIAKVFGISPDMIPMGTAALRWYVLGGLGAGVSVMLGAYWQAVAKESDTLCLTFLRTFVVYLIAAIPLAMGPLSTFWLIYPLTEWGSLLVFALGKHFRSDSALVMSDRDSVPIYHRMLSGGAGELGVLLEETEEFCTRHCANINQTMMAGMVVEEVCQAIFLHVSEGQMANTYIQITLFPVDSDCFELHIRDNAPAFDPFSLRTMKISEADDEEGAMEGIGILMVKKKAKEFFYRHYLGFNTLTVRM